VPRPSTPVLGRPIGGAFLSRPALLAALSAIALIAYSNSFSAGFVLDSRVLLLEDTRLRAFTAETLGAIFGHTYWWPFLDTPLYRPLTTVSYLLNYMVLDSGVRPAGYHVVNWLLHTANAWLLFHSRRDAAAARGRAPGSGRPGHGNLRGCTLP
jgi:hypothetical protein